MTPLIHVWTTAEEDRAEFNSLLATWGLQLTCMSSVNAYTHAHTDTQTAVVVHTRFSLSRLICQVFICPEVVNELQAVACVFVAGSYLVEVIGLSLMAVETERQHDRLSELIIDREMAPI